MWMLDVMENGSMSHYTLLLLNVHFLLLFLAKLFLAQLSLLAVRWPCGRWLLMKFMSQEVVGLQLTINLSKSYWGEKKYQELIVNCW